MRDHCPKQSGTILNTDTHSNPQQSCKSEGKGSSNSASRIAEETVSPFGVKTVYDCWGQRWFIGRILRGVVIWFAPAPLRNFPDPERTVNQSKNRRSQGCICLTGLYDKNKLINEELMTSLSMPMSWLYDYIINTHARNKKMPETITDNNSIISACYGQAGNKESGSWLLTYLMSPPPATLQPFNFRTSANYTEDGFRKGVTSQSIYNRKSKLLSI